MADEAEGQRAAAAGEGADLSAIALALSSAAHNARVAAKAESFLEKQARLSEKQSALVELQAEELRRELGLHHWSARIHHLSGILKLAFEFAVALIVLAVAGLIGSAIWNAAHDRGLVIEAFQVPPDLASRGLTGQVVAGQLLDKLTAMQNATQSARPAQSYANNWGNDIKVQIPDTGVSIGEFNHYLEGWLGHETHIGGEVFRSATGITVTARVSGGGNVSFGGPETSLDALLQRAAEHIYEQTQPYRYAVYRTHGLNGASDSEWNESRQVLTRLTLDSDGEERAWAWLGLANIALFHDADARRGTLYLRRALSNKRDFVVALIDLAQSEGFLGHGEAAVMFGRAAETGLDRLPSAQPALTVYGLENAAATETVLGDFSGVIAETERAAELPDMAGRAEYFREIICGSLAFEHDGRAARSALRAMPGLPAADMPYRASRLELGFLINVALHNWPAVVAQESAVEKAQRAGFPGWDNTAILATGYRPWLALAKAELGDGTGAGRVIGATPPDCYDCVRVRGKIAALAQRWGAAAYWFRIATKQGPSLPFAYTDWGEMLMARGDYDAAIAQFTLANRKSPHFADPLEMWGEALMQKNRSDLALAKFAEADKFAPNWGRLHLKWGEALFYAGNRNAARKQFALTSALDLSAPELSELARNKRRI
ncbi:MAG TPA: hypothetical protein VGL35_08355 [Rhizomicrobium sp.]|jgi:tetratricopeptide (TPR) repeat protein